MIRRFTLGLNCHWDHKSATYMAAATLS